MPIPKGTVYNERSRTAGEIAEHYPAEYISSHPGEGNIPFGRGVVVGSDANSAKIPDDQSGKFIGVAGYSSQASDIENETYNDGDPVAVVKKGIVVVDVEESVEHHDSVRLAMDNEAKAPGYQTWGFTEDRELLSSSGLNDSMPARAEHIGTANLSAGHDWTSSNEDFVINVNGQGNETIVLDGQYGNITTLVAGINVRLTNAGITDVEAFVSTNFVGLRTIATGLSQNFVLSPGTSDALPTLGWTAATYAGEDGVLYEAQVGFNGSSIFDIELFGYENTNIGDVIDTIQEQIEGNGVITLSDPRTFKIESVLTGDISAVEIIDSSLFASLEFANSMPDAAVPGSDDPDPALEAGKFRTTAMPGRTILIEHAEFIGSDDDGKAAIWLESPLSISAD
jgi:hypothetical protein